MAPFGNHLVFSVQFLKIKPITPSTSKFPTSWTTFQFLLLFLKTKPNSETKKIVLKNLFLFWNLVKNSTLSLKKNVNHCQELRENKFAVQKPKTKNKMINK